MFKTAKEIFASLEPEVKLALAKYPTKDKQSVYPTLHDACADEDAPTLACIDREHGMGTSLIWLSIQLVQVADYTGIREKLRWNQLEDTARNLLMVGNDYGVTLAEMMHFFARFEQGYYQQFIGYERPNPQVITKSFRRFVEEEIGSVRERVFQEQEREKLQKEREEAKRNAVPCPEHIAKKLEKLYNHFNVNTKE